MKISKAISEWKQWHTATHSPYTTKTMETKLKVWSRGQKNKDISEVTWEQLHEFINTFLIKKGIVLGTVKQYHSSLKSLFKFMVGKGVVSANPMDIVHINRRTMSIEQLEPAEKVPFTHSDYKKLMGHFKMVRSKRMRVKQDFRTKFWSIAVPLSYASGLRLSDCITLEYSSLRPKGLICWTNKRGKRVMIEWEDMKKNLPADSVLDVLSFKSEIARIRIQTGGWLKIAMKDPGNARYVFGAPQWGTFVDDCVSNARTSHLSTEFERMTKKIGIINPNNGNGKSFHMLRHAFVTRLSENGVSLKEISKKVGHGSTAMTSVYNHADPFACSTIPHP